MKFVGTKQQLISELKSVARMHRSKQTTGLTDKERKHHADVAYGLEYAILMLERWQEEPVSLLEVAKDSAS